MLSAARCSLLPLLHGRANPALRSNTTQSFSAVATNSIRQPTNQIGLKVRPLTRTALPHHLHTSEPAFHTAMSARSTHTASGGRPTVPYERYSANWWKEYIIILSVFAVTGSSSLFVVRPALKHVFGLEGTWCELVDCICCGRCTTSY